MSGAGDVDLEPFVRLALACVTREFPTHVSYVVRTPDELRLPRAVTPAFWGCFDWHSSVHSHWLLARAARLFPKAAYVPDARSTLARTLAGANIDGELAFLRAHPTFERPYGLAWALALDAELRLSKGAEAQTWADVFRPLGELAADRLRAWLPKLTHPVRVGTHTQTAFSLGLALDWARVSGDDSLVQLISARALDWHAADHDLPLWMEPSGEDFLSPSFGVADLMRRVVSPEELARWLDRALPTIPRDGRGDWLAPVTPRDRSDGRLAHLDGLSLSRASMLEAVAEALPADDSRVPAIRAAATVHAAHGLAATTGERYEGAHWLGTYATYLLTRAWRQPVVDR